ncbi:helix-turn-helix domain-containing protein [Alkalicoccus chagannorensis]|uniref:helix-turn-helix domain-containing protein n=1 Tax=Alkalicoccus chagannorensis TaxID=427072 RepID=UPI000416142F|nr:helix-turn-helix domain-containing protein [Alkalicoccus chagannorensis]
MSTNSLGKEIVALRTSNNMTQKQLSDGICTQPTIRMIERGDITPALDTIYFISLKLKKPLRYFINILFSDSFSRIDKLVVYIEELTTQQKYEVVNEIVVKELYENIENEWYQHFLKWQYYLSAYEIKKIDFNEAIKSLKELIQKKYDLIIMRDFLKERIYNTIAFLYAKNQEIDLALFYYNKINFDEEIIISPRHNINIYYLRVMFNKSKTLFDSGNYTDAIALIKEGIDKSIKAENMSFIGNFYYYLGMSYEVNNNSYQDIRSCYKNAEYFFDLLGRELHLNILHSKKSEYIN